LPAVNTVKTGEAETSVGKMDETEFEEGEFQNKTKQKKNEVKQPKYEKKQKLKFLSTV
jgi:hypothetical protein